MDFEMNNHAAVQLPNNEINKWDNPISMNNNAFREKNLFKEDLL
jgi:hypothetical protein